MPGRLILVSTPIGNLEDLSPRAKQAFEQADLVLCEDTRHTGRLLSRLGIDKRLMSLHEHNERGRVSGLIEMLEQGATLALTSDAGTPLISDPGFPLVRQAVAAGVTVEHRPGAPWCSRVCRPIRSPSPDFRLASGASGGGSTTLWPASSTPWCSSSRRTGCWRVSTMPLSSWATGRRRSPAS